MRFLATSPRPTRPRSFLPATAVLTATAVLAGCGGTEGAHGTATGEGATSASATPTPQVGTPEDYRDEAAKIVADFSDEELAGHVVLGGWGTTDAADAAELVETNHLAGVIVMRPNLEGTTTDAELADFTSTIASARGSEGEAPVFVGVDQEGGYVSRLDDLAQDFPSLMAFGATGDTDLTTSAYAAQGAQLRDLGFTTGFGPDADVTRGAEDPVINVRSGGDDPDAVADMVGAAVTGYNAAGLASTPKHFPGHGNLTVDSHESLPVSTKSIADMAERDLKPFEAAVDADTPMIMMGHIGLPGAESTPASLNPDAYAELHERLDYDGLVVTDALNMGAVTDTHAARSAIEAGADLALLPSDPVQSQQDIAGALASGELERDRLVEANERVVAMQLWQEKAAEAGAPSDEKARADIMAESAAASLTVVSGECRIAEPLTEVSVTGSDSVVATFTEVAEKAGLTVSDSAATSVGLDRAGDVAVDLGGPWELPAGQTQLAIYDDYEAGLTAVAEYLTGELEAKGKLPVEVDGVEPPQC